MRRLAALLLLLAATASAQTFSRGSRELTFWGSGGHAVSGGFSDAGLFSAGVRLGWVLFSPGGHASLEYVVDFAPVNVIAQRNGATYGAGFSPVIFKLNFSSGRIVPYLEGGGGLLFTRDEVPPGSSNVNFTPQVGLGVSVPLRRDRGPRLDLAIRYVHISNAGLSVPNPGINTIQGRIGLQFLRHRK